MNARIALCGLALALAPAVSAQDFTLTIQPSTLTLIPDQNASFVVSLAPFGGFTSQVTLAVGTLPSGVTAQFSPATLTPPGSSILQLSAATNAQLGAFTLNVTAIGGGITNTTSSSVTVNFGLLPICTGAFRGQVTDIVTGLPLTNVTVVASYGSQTAAATDATGMFIFTNLPLAGSDNQPANYSFSVSSTDYWPPPYATAYAVCDATNVVNLQLLRKETGSLSGQVVVQGGGPLPGVEVTVGGLQPAITDTNGFFQFTGLPLSYSNAPATYTPYTSIPGYWQSTSNVVINANSNAVVTLTLIPVCYATVKGNVIFSDSGLPAANASVSLSAAGGGSASVTTNTNGNYIATNISLAFDNASTTAYASASYGGYYSASANSPLATCGETVTLGTLALQPIPRTIDNYGAVAGHVYDIQTGQPITNAQVSSSQANAYTDTNGAYYLTNILVGTGATTNVFESVFATATAYFSASSNLTFYANEVVTQDLRLLRIGYGAVVGTVRDSVSTLPIQGASVSLPGAGQTDANGHYASGLLPLNSPNVPTAEGISVSATGYWPSSTNTTITQGATNVVDVNLLKVCTGATIVGNVVDALTQKPITNALVSVTGAISRSDMTDTNGNFILTNLTVGTDNSPIQNTITAEAPGYNSQSRNVTIFCSATIITEFGAPQTVFGGIDGYATNVLTGLPLTNVFVGSGFGAATYTDTNGYYTFSQVPLGANGASRVWTVTAIPQGFPQQTKSVSVSSNTVSRLDFGFGQPPTALFVTATGTPNPVTVGSNLLYVVTLTNTVAEAQEVQLSDALPPGVTFVSAALTNSPGTPFSVPVYSNNLVTATAAEFASNSAVALAILVTPTIAGTLTNVATVSSSTTDLDPTGSNHTATVITTVIAPVVTNGPPPTNVAVQALGPPTFNPQTGLYEQSVLFTNLSGVPAAAVRVAVLGLASSVALYNATGTNNGTPYVEYDQTVPAGGGVVFLLEYYDASRPQTLVSTNFVATAVAPATPPVFTGTVLQLDSNGTNGQFLSEGRLTIEFITVPGHTYVVQYLTNVASLQWQTAVPPIVAGGTKTQWIDSGPPKTVSPPGGLGLRIYRVVQTN